MKMFRKREANPKLSRDELLARFQLFSSPDLSEEVYKLAKEQLASEAARETALNAKATSLLTASGLSLTVTFTFGGLLLEHPDYLKTLSACWAYVVPTCYGLALLSGIVASFFALLALRVRGDHVTVAERDVFQADVLSEADKWDDGTQNSGAPPKAGTAYYRRFMANAIWIVMRQNFDIHERKAKQIQRGQGFFFLFLIFIAAIGVALAFASFDKQRARLAKIAEEQMKLTSYSSMPQATHALDAGTGQEMNDGGPVSTAFATDASVAPLALDTGDAGTTPTDAGSSTDAGPSRPDAGPVALDAK